MPRIGEVLETALYIDDMERSVRFYSDVLGFKSAHQSYRLSAMWVNETQVLLLFKKGASSEPIITPGDVIPPMTTTAKCCSLHFRGDGSLSVPGATMAPLVPPWPNSYSHESNSPIWITL